MSLPKFHEGIQLGPINLDCMSDAELAEAVAHPALHADVRVYARRLLSARKARLAGDITTALKLEAINERNYSAIPSKLKW